MLELKSIKKDYPAGDGKVEALKGIDLRFRDSEFVSILGPSGCGKTTTLNIIGGLDQYSSGDLVINGVSTKNYKDRDWDTYRNHSVGFVFQSYNLIPHQSVLQNVEIALSLSGVSKAERRKRAKEALERVGLGDQLKKKPSQMSGGQMQRVAIARAIVTDPDIILADEPTGALDTETSLQVMEILKEISKDRLVIMVTHNPDIAEKYSTRIIRMLDGMIQSDSNPITEAEAAQIRTHEKKREKLGRKKMPSMSLATSFGLSLKNLFTKKGRTALTSFAGSVGIIGIALIFAVSQGMTSYINIVQEEALSSYPLTLESTQMDTGSLIAAFAEQAENSEHDQDAVYEKGMLYKLMNALNNAEEKDNDLAAFKVFLENELADENSTSGLYSAITGVQYTYDVTPIIYTKNVDGKIIESDTTAMLRAIMMQYMSSMDISSGTMSSSGISSNSGSGSSGTPLWQEMLPGNDGKLVNEVLEKQYDLVYGSWPTQYNEIVLVLDENNELSDMVLYALGLTSEEEISKLVEAALNETEVKVSNNSWTYEEICEMEFRTILASDCYRLDEKTGLYTDLRDADSGLTYLYDHGTVLKVSGIIRPNADASSPMLSGSIGYTSKLTEYIIESAENSAAVQAQKANPTMDIFTGLLFQEATGSMTAAEKEAAFKQYIASLDEKGKAATYIEIQSTPSEAQVSAAVQQTLSVMTRADLEQQMLLIFSSQISMSEAELNAYITSMSDEDLSAMFSSIVAEQFKGQYAEQVKAQLSALTTAQLAAALENDVQSYTPEQFALYHDEVLKFSTSDFESNMLTLGSVDIDNPSSINLYASSFEDKEIIEDAIASYNSSLDELEQLSYTDYVGLMMSSVTTIINAITYVLVAFVAVSLIVSSIMIAVITLISVQERIKEIGILRAIGASKKNVSRMFNAETMIIGFTSGVVGVLVTYLFCIPINAILRALSGIGNLKAYLPVPVAITLVCISVFLTLISGIIPSRSAAKKDPVVALRSE